MKLSQTELKALHKHSFENLHLIQDAKQAGCFCCLEVFPNTVKQHAARTAVLILSLQTMKTSNSAMTC